MNLRSLLSVAILVAAPLSAGEYDALAKTLHQTWPQCGSVAVVCDATGSKAAVDAVTGAFSGMKVIVVDVKGPQDIGKAVSALTSRKPDAVVLLPSDKVVSDGSSAASFLIQRMAAAKVPTVATTEAAVRQGAVLGMGHGTGGKLLANAKVAGVAGVTVPAGAREI